VPHIAETRLSGEVVEEVVRYPRKTTGTSDLLEQDACFEAEHKALIELLIYMDLRCSSRALDLHSANYRYLDMADVEMPWVAAEML
jgi:hypothetical protein